MSRIALVHRTDVHVNSRSPASWKASYPEEVWSNLAQVGALARDRGAVAVLDGGDYFHDKAPSRNPHHLLERTAQIHKVYPCPVWCVEGNHDMAHNRLESIPQQPLGVLYAAGVFQHLRETVFEDGPLRVRVVGVPFSPFRHVDDLRKIQKQPGDTHLIAVVHQLAAQAPPASVEDFFNEPVFRYSDLVTPDGPDVWCFGHWHKDQGIVNVGGKHFVNQGALSRGALNHDNLSRIPRAAVIEVTESGLYVVSHPMQVAPAEDVFDIAQKERADKEEAVIQDFVSHLQLNLTQGGESDLAASLHALDIPGEVRDLVHAYLDRARSETK